MQGYLWGFAIFRMLVVTMLTCFLQAFWVVCFLVLRQWLLLSHMLLLILNFEHRANSYKCKLLFRQTIYFYV